jgi:hypothetical protein
VVGGGLVGVGGGVLADGGAVIAVGGGVVAPPDPPEAVLDVALSNEADDPVDVAAVTPDAAAPLPLEPAADPAVSAPPETVGPCGAAAPAVLPPAPPPAWGLAGKAGMFGVVKGSAVEVRGDGGWLDPTVRPARTSKNAAVTPLMAATARW